ncbi:SAM-dependent methyltransferase [Qingshengfaniella alkalisoli]|uniref:Class I SAM-dependent methyltransferase n=1 Tax=Qingshengfaniella alkalisoli TaxID=2599296 RepID=A0A5B8IWG9_9RHOB|nr:cyclopropane-fatty-acyl-phospholipid synthase family protein [Qingshengfaniella alkalisoli]QDY69171.1 class I SAM-dependent methyltransferase [Qingshengfaniella alkalisoli]
MQFLTTTDAQSGLPRYFAEAFHKASGIAHGRLDVVLPDGRGFRIDSGQPGPVAHVDVHNHDLFARLLRDGYLGFSEAYLDGWWSTPDLQAFMDLVHTDFDMMLDGFTAVRVVRAFERFRFWLKANTKAQARKNISYHYDLGNDFYATWLDDTMTYSSALFETGQESMEAAQRAKYASLIDRMDVQPGDHILEIGCGWGGFAEYAAAERGLKVTGLTISQEQLDFARARIEKAGLSDQVELKLQDYRDEKGRYDGIASIEMFEAVGMRYWPSYFNVLRECLKEGAAAALQIILIEDRRFHIYSKNVDFIQKYIFPGGMLPSPSVLRDEAAKAGLKVVGSFEFGESYSQTLRRWHVRFNEEWDRIRQMGFDDRFRRMWNYYLTSCAAGFHAGACDVTQITVTADDLRSPSG